MVVDRHRNLEIFPSSTTNPRSFYLPSTESELPPNDQFIFEGTDTLDVTIFEDESIDYFEFDSNARTNIYIAADPSYNDGGSIDADCGIRQSTIASRGYIKTNKDWKNFEATIWVYVQTVTDENKFIWIQGRSGLHPTGIQCCEGSAYGIRNYWASTGSLAGQTSTTKEHYHSVLAPPKNEKPNGLLNNIKQRWVGIKLIVYTTTENNRSVTVIRHYMCPNIINSNTDWRLISETKDFTGAGWKNTTNLNDCGAPSVDQAITWGGPYIVFGWNDAQVLRFRKLSVREIQPPNVTNPPSGGGDPPPSGGLVPKNTILYKVKGSGSQGKWDNGQARTITGHEEYDPFNDLMFISAGENRKLVIDGNGKATQSGARARQYILVSNYNASMEVEFKMNSSLDNLSLRLRSRHNEGGGGSNRFGGYGCAVGHNSVEMNRENYHNDHKKFGDHSFSPSLSDGQVHRVRYLCEDVQNGVRLTFQVFENGAFKTKASAIDTNPLDYMVDKDLSLTSGSKYGNDISSYAWIRTNGNSPRDIEITDCIIRDITLVPSDGSGGQDPDPDPDCPEGYHKDNHGNCVPDIIDPDCPAGQHKNANGVCVPNNPPDGGTDPDPPSPPPIPASFKRSITFVRNINNNSQCRCLGVPSTGGGGGGGGGDPDGGGGGTYSTIYKVSHNGGKVIKMADVASQKSEFYLRVAQKITKSNSVFINATIKVIKIFLAENNNPYEATGLGVHVVIRDSSDAIMVDFGYILEDDIFDAGSMHTITKENNEYKCKQGDYISFEFDGGGTSEYIKIFYKTSEPNTGSLIARQNNNQAAGTWSELNDDLCMTIEGLKS